MELVSFFSFVVVSGKCLTGATCPGLTDMQLFPSQLLKSQKDENQGGTSQSLAHLHWRYNSCLVGGGVVCLGLVGF